MAARTWSDTVEQLLQEVECNVNYNDSLNEIIKGISDRELKFYEFVEFLGKHLSDTNEVNRANGCRCLVEVLHRLPRSYLTTEEAGFLSTFLRDRLQDKDSVVKHTLYGIVALSRIDTISDEDAVSTMCTLLREIGPLNQTRTVNDRKNVYLIFLNMLQNRLNALKTMRLDFVSGFIQTIDGEKDPANLVMVFNMIFRVIKNFDVGPLIEDLFEVTGCYFPIDYTPPPNNTKGITREELILGLRKCLSSTSEFAEYCVPMLLEKMDSDIPDAKIDALLTLASCAEIYGSGKLHPYYIDAYRSIRREVCSGGNELVERAALHALSALIKTASSTVILSNGHNDFLTVISEILTECLSNLCQPGMKLTYPSAKLLQATARGSSVACEKVIDSVIPLLLEQVSLITETDQRSTILDVLNGFLETCRQDTQEDFKPLRNFKRPILDLFMALLSANCEVNLRRASITGLLTIAITPFYLENSEVEAIIESLSNVIIHDRDQNVRHEGLIAISKVADDHAGVTRETLLPHLLNVIRTMNAVDEEDLYAKHLSLLAAVTIDTDSLQLVTKDLLNQLHSILLDGEDLVRAKAIAGCILDISVKTCTLIFWQNGILTDLLSLSYSNWSNLIKDDVILLTISKILQNVVPHHETKESCNLLLTSLKVFLESNSQKGMNISLVECIISCAKREVLSQLPGEYFEAIVTICMKVLQENPGFVDDTESLSICRCLASLVNKMENDEHLESLLATLLERILVDSNQNFRIITLLIWLTKAATMRGHNSMDSFIDKMFVFLGKEDTCEQISNGFQFVLSELQEALNYKCHAQILLFYKQRFFVTTSPRLIDGFNNSKLPDIQYAFLKALILQLPLLPKEGFVSDLPTLIPILIKGMICNKASILLPILTTLAIILKQDAKLVENDADTLIPHLIELSAFTGVMKVRIAALENLNYLTKLPAHLIVQHKENIIHGLALILDDPKRLVRKAAVTTRTNWCLLGSPGGT